MRRRVLVLASVGLLAGLLAVIPGPGPTAPAAASRPRCSSTGSGTTVDGTISDLDGDRLLEAGPGEAPILLGFDAGERFGSQCRELLSFLQLTDFQMVDEESPGRVEFLDATQQVPGAAPFSAAYRP